MINRIIPFVFVLFQTLVFSQNVTGTYNYNCSVRVKDPNTNSDGDCQNDFSLSLCSSNNCFNIFYNINLDYTYNSFKYFSRSIDISSDYFINHTNSNALRNWENFFGCVDNNREYRDRYISSTSGNYFYYSDILPWWASDLSYTRTPKLTIINPTPYLNYFEIDDPAGLTIKSHVGFASNEYIWEYNNPLRPINGPDDWKRISAYNGLSTINFRIEDILPPGVNKKEYYGKTLDVRQVAWGTVISNVYSCAMIKTPPLLVSQIPNITDTKCSYGSDGTATFTFGRDLEKDLITLIPSEYFLFNIYKRQGDYNNDINISTPYISSVNDILLPNISKYNYDDVVNKKIDLGNFTPGNYYMTYSTKFNNPLGGVQSFVSAIIPSEPRSTVYKSLYNSRLSRFDNVQVDTRVIPFTIKAPTPLVYTARMAQPKCAGGSVEIVINTKGGRPPYYYCINCPNDNSRIQYTSDTGVPNPDHGLPNGDYIITIPGSITGSNISIKVTDSKNCVDPATIAPQ